MADTIAIRTGRKHKRKGIAILSLYGDEGGTAVSAYPADWNGDDPESLIYELISEGVEETDEIRLTMMVCGWLRQHGYTGARWASEDLNGFGKPNWARATTYRWAVTRGKLPQQAINSLRKLMHSPRFAIRLR